MDLESEVFYSPETSFHQDEHHSMPKSHESEELKILESKNSNYSITNPKLIQIPSSLRSKESIQGLKALPIFPKFESKKPKLEYNHLRLLQELDFLEKQSFTRWVISFSQDSNYLSIGGSGRLIYIYSLSKRPTTTTCIYPYPEKILNDHGEEITALSWSKDLKLLSSGKDCKVKLWDPLREEMIKSFDHPEKVTFCRFYRNSDNHFVTACKDNLLRVYSISETQPIGYYQIPMTCYSLDFDLKNQYLAVGLDKGEVLLYSVKDDYHLRIYNKFLCKNRKGIHSKGKKVVGLKFVTEDWLLVTTADSRIRIMKYLDGVCLQKFKGHKNSKARICPDYLPKDKILVSGSENGKVFFWKYEEGLLKNSKFEAFRVRNKKCAEYAVLATQKLEEEIRQRYFDGIVNFALFSIGAKEMMKGFLVLHSK